MATTPQLQAIEQQLACPQGEQGLDIANMMHATNINMTLNGWQCMRLAPNSRVLELGHGNAAHVTPLLQKRSDIHYTGLEISELMCEQASLINQDMVNHYRAIFWHYDGQYIPSFMQAFDGILSVNTIYFWEQPQSFLNQLKQQLSALGRLALVYMDPEFLQTLPFVGDQFKPYAPNQLEALLEQTGFQNITTKSFKDEVTRKDQSTATRLFHVTTAQR